MEEHDGPTRRRLNKSKTPMMRPVTFNDDEIEGMTRAIMKAHETEAIRTNCLPGVRQNGEGTISSILSTVFLPIFDTPTSERYMDLTEQLTVLTSKTVKDHPFVDGNKRTALKTMLAMILMYGGSMNVTDSSSIEKNILAGWIINLASGRSIHDSTMELRTMIDWG